MIHIDIDKDGDVTLTRQIYTAISKHILEGVLKKHDKLPSSRSLALHLGVSRNVIMEAYDQLLAEGYIISKGGSGTFVADGAFLENYKVRLPNVTDHLTGLRHEPNHRIIDFRPGVPDLSLFPIAKWGQLYKSTCEDLTSSVLDYYGPQGCYALRYELSRYLQRSRGVVCSPDQILITTGAAQAFTITSRALLNKSKYAILEDPINKDIMEIIQRTGAKIYSIPVDNQGIVTENLPDIDASFIFTTPSHQFPLGGILSIKRRIQLIHYAEKHAGYIIEDDYDSEYRYVGSPIRSMQSLNPDRVIYVGSFSKKLYPALRIGFMVLPEALVEELSRAKHLEDIHSPILEQITLAQFIKKGLLDKHINISRKVYMNKRKLLEKELSKAFGNDIEILGNSTGIHLIIKFKKYRFPNAQFHRFEKYGLRVHSIDDHTTNKGLHDDKLMLGYGNLSHEEIKQGIYRLQQACANLFKI